MFHISDAFSGIKKLIPTTAAKLHINIPIFLSFLNYEMQDVLGFGSAGHNCEWAFWAQIKKDTRQLNYHMIVSFQRGGNYHTHQPLNV